MCMHSSNTSIGPYTHGCMVASATSASGPCRVGVQELRAARRDGAGAVAATHGTDADPGAREVMVGCNRLL